MNGMIISDLRGTKKKESKKKQGRTIKEQILQIRKKEQIIQMR